MITARIDIRRQRDGKIAIEPLEISFDRDSMVLVIGSEWRKRRQEFATVRTYRIEEFAVDMTGRGFMLYRSRRDIAADRDNIDRYAVLVSPDGLLCDCFGQFVAEKSSTWIKTCKHATCMSWILQHGHLPENKPTTRPAGAIEQNEARELSASA